MTQSLDRREALRLVIATSIAASCGSLSGAAWTAGHSAHQTASTLLHKAIPKSGEKLPVIGLGTNNYSPTTDEERAMRREVVAALTARGASVIDTAPSYRESERTLGELIAEIGNREKIFLATKVTAQSGTREEGVAMLEESRRKLRSDKLDLVQVHNLVGTRVLLPLLREQVDEGRIRYIGVTTSSARQYAELAGILRNETLDFVQLDYSIANREAARELLPIAADRGVAVLVNLPLGGRRGSLFARVRDQALPDWAAELDAGSWSQFFLKYIVSHPAVTCAIPGMTRVANLEDNLGAARGALPDAALRRRMEAYWDTNFAES
jgi:aryl-alcohol dehydrogenase-like predicted oxidoreductase